MIPQRKIPTQYKHDVLDGIYSSLEQGKYNEARDKALSEIEKITEDLNKLHERKKSIEAQLKKYNFNFRTAVDKQREVFKISHVPQEVPEELWAEYEDVMKQVDELDLKLTELINIVNKAERELSIRKSNGLA